MALDEQEGGNALDLVSRLPSVPEPKCDIYPEEDSPTFFLPGVSDTDVLASLVPALVALGSDEVRVGRPPERLEKGEWIVRLCWELRNKPGVAAIWQDVRVSKEMGGIGIAVKSKRYTGRTAETIILQFCGVLMSFIGWFGCKNVLEKHKSPPLALLLGSLVPLGIYLFVFRPDNLEKTCRFEEIPQKAAIIRDSVVACIEEVFRKLRIPEGMIKRSGKSL